MKCFLNMDLFISTSSKLWKQTTGVWLTYIQILCQRKNNNTSRGVSNHWLLLFWIVSRCYCNSSQNTKVALVTIRCWSLDLQVAQVSQLSPVHTLSTLQGQYAVIAAACGPTCDSTDHCCQCPSGGVFILRTINQIQSIIKIIYFSLFQPGICGLRLGVKLYS